MTQQQLAKSIEKKRLEETPQNISCSVREQLTYRDEASETSSVKIIEYSI